LIYDTALPTHFDSDCEIHTHHIRIYFPKQTTETPTTLGYVYTMNDISQAEAKLRDLHAKIQAEDIDGAKSCLTELKILILGFPTGAEAPVECVNIATETFEQAALLSLQEGDLSAFARNVSQVKPYYESTTTTTNNTNTTTNNKAKLLGLNLMYLLTENLLSEFHAELELLTDDAMIVSSHNNPLITFPVTLERQLMVGSYDEVLNAGSHVPDPAYDLFVDNLLQTVRDNIADCLEVAYQSVTLEAAKIAMKFDTLRDLREYVADCRDDWILQDDGVLCFQPPSSGSKASDVPSRPLIKQVLSYATELERIV